MTYYWIGDLNSNISKTSKATGHNKVLFSLLVCKQTFKAKGIDQCSLTKWSYILNKRDS
jgi:hypothetical protein